VEAAPPAAEGPQTPAKGVWGLLDPAGPWQRQPQRQRPGGPEAEEAEAFRTTVLPALAPAFAHQAGSNYHYHANTPALRYQLGDHVDYNANSKTYSESTTTATAHSPILGWMADGYPVYGPYGYASPMNAASGVRRMIPGYVKRDGTNGTTNLNITGRTTLPAWAARAQNRSATLASNVYGPAGER
jgi:hypothetical protein